jgi:hypothetical protein
MDTSVQYDAFLSYARRDDEPFVARLYHDLTSRPHAFRIRWDREKMPNRGLTFSQEIRDSIDASARLIGILGPRALASESVRAEWDHAQLFARATVIVPRLCGYDLVPPEFAGYHGPDFYVRCSRRGS